jgi:enoyl-CoA hydratase/carnithine racemase
MTYSTIRYEVRDSVATVTLNRPEILNAFDYTMCDEFADVWRRVRRDDDVHVVVLRAAGRAFSTGADTSNLRLPDNPWSEDSPGFLLAPKHQRVWKPVVCAVNGMAAGGAFYWINEADVVICGDDATFFDPHVTYGLTAAWEPIGLARRIPLGEVLRMALLGLDERLSARRALEIGLVSEVVPPADLWARAGQIATQIAEKPPAAIQGTVRAIWESLDLGRTAAASTAMLYPQIGNPLGTEQVDAEAITGSGRRSWNLR